MEATIRPFIQLSAEVNCTLMEILGKKLGFKAGRLTELHRLDETSGSETRCIRNPPRPGGISEEKAALGAHTDFGSMVGCYYWRCSFGGGADTSPPPSSRPDLLAQPSGRLAGDAPGLG